MNLKNYKDKSKTIPIVLFLYNKYEPIIYTTIISILENGNKNTYYSFYLIVPSNFSTITENLFLGIHKKYQCYISFILVPEKFENLINIIPNNIFQNYHLLLLGDLIPKEINKCIYLGADICVNHDLSDLFKIDMKNNYIAGVISLDYYFSEKNQSKRLNLTSMKEYVNKNVLLINLKQIRINNMTREFIKLSKNHNFKVQDILNILCYGNIIKLPLKFNVMPSYIKKNNKILKYFYKKEDIFEAKNSPYIIQYSDQKKPWNNIGIYMERYWWNIAKKTPFINKLFTRENIYKNKIKKFWYNIHHKKLNFDNLTTFNEKLQWLKLYDSTPIKTMLSDKYLVKEFVKKKIGEKYVIPLLGVYGKFEEIDFKSLPNQFVIKCNHGSGFNIIVKNKTHLNFKRVRAKINKWMNRNYAFFFGFELHYRDIKPKIIIEQFMDDNTGDLRDYKINCFNGKPYFIWLDSDRHSSHKRNLYDLKWNQLPYKVNTKYPSFPSPKRPKHLEKMIDLASILSKNFAYVRVDFYIINDNIFFGEMTFETSSGTEDISPSHFEKKLSSLLILPKLAYNIDTGEYYEWGKKFLFI